MKKVLQCDFCSHIENIEEIKSIDIMTNHEVTCTFNPNNKTCYTCKHYDHDDWISFCIKNFNSFKGVEEGNCEGWELEN